MQLNIYAYLHTHTLVGYGVAFSLPLNSSVWLNNSKYIQQIDRKIANFNTGLAGIHISMRFPKTVRQSEVSMSFWTKKWEAGVKGESGKFTSR